MLMQTHNPQYAAAVAAYWSNENQNHNQYDKDQVALKGPTVQPKAPSHGIQLICIVFALLILL
jgi:hypothetical protein